MKAQVVPIRDAQRTEVEVAAQVICRLFMEGVLNSNAHTVAEVARVSGVPVDAIRWAWRNYENRPYRPPVEAPMLNPAESRSDRATKASRSTKNYQDAHPVEGMRVCNRCGETLPVEQFAWKNQTKNIRRGYCTDCWKAKCRERYLSVQKRGLLNEARLTFVLGEGDEITGLACLDCGQPLRVGDHVTGRSTLHHVDCQETTHNGGPHGD